MARIFSAIRCDCRRSVCVWRHRAEAWLRRFRRGCRYVAGKLSADEAQTMIAACEQSAGWFPLMILSVEDVLERARETFVEHPEMHDFIAEACIKVHRKWESYGGELEEAIRWAIEIAEEYAANEGVSFGRLTDDMASSSDEEGEEQ